MKAWLTRTLKMSLMATLLIQGTLPALALDGDGSQKQSSEPEAAAKASAETKAQDPGFKKGPFSDFDARMVETERRILEGLACGRLIPQQAEELKTHLDSIAEEEAKFRQNPGKFTHWQNVRLHTWLDKLNDFIDRKQGDRELASVDLQFTREDLGRRIDLSARQGRLTPPEVADLKQEFNRINALAGMLHKEKGRLSYPDKLMLCIDYDHLGAKLASKLAKRPLAMPDLASQRASIENKIQEGLKSGKLSQQKSEEVKQKLSELSSSSEAFGKSGAKISQDQIIELGLVLEDLANQLEDSLNPKRPDLDTRLKKIDLKLASALDEGNLNPLEAFQLKEDLDAISTTKESLLAKAALKSEEESSLTLEAARLEGRLDRQIHGPNRLFPGLLVYLVQLSHRSKQAEKAKRLSEYEASEFRSTLASLNKKHAEYLRDGMNSAQALKLAQDLQKLSGQLDKSMKDRPMEFPNIEGLRDAIDNRIAESAVSGKLSVGDARTAVLKLAGINSVKEKYSASESILSDREKFAVAFELERLSCKLEEQMHGHAAFFPGLDTRRAQIEALIEEGVSSGRLNTVSQDFYRQKLSESRKLEKQYREDSTGLTGDKAIELVNSLEDCWAQLDRELREVHVMINDLISLEGSAEKKMREGFCSGYLDVDETEMVRRSYDRLVLAFNKMRADDGGLSYGERLAYAYGFQRLQAYTERNLETAPLILPQLEHKHDEMEQKLASFLASGRLPLEEGKDFKALLDEIGAAAAEKRSSGGGISYQECLTVVSDMDRLSRRINQRAAAAKQLPDIDSMQAELDKKIEAEKAKGNLSPEKYKELKEEMDRLESNEAEFRISEEALNYAEAVNLLESIKQIQDRLKAAPKKEASDTKKTDSKTSSKKRSN